MFIYYQYYWITISINVVSETNVDAFFDFITYIDGTNYEIDKISNEYTNFWKAQIFFWPLLKFVDVPWTKN